MASSNCILFLVLLAVQGSIQKSTPTSPTYKAAVVEYNPVVEKNDPVKTLSENAEIYDRRIKEAVDGDADIVVFPEFGLTSLDILQRSELIHWASSVPDSSKNFVPCEANASQVLKTISCSAQHNSIYVVINLIEKESCSEPDCNLFYSTNVVFDRSGKIIARYRRFHQFENLGLFNTTKSPELSTFKTDFGVTFATATSFDIMYENPLLTLIEESGITDIVYPAAWRSEVPFLTAIQLQAGWACAKEVNLLSAGYNRINDGYSGSGIYAGCRLDEKTLKTAGILIHQVPKVSRKAASLTELKNDGKHDLRFTNDSHQSHVHDELRRKRNLEGLNVKYEQLGALDCKKEVISANGLTEKKLKHKSIECHFRVDVAALIEPTTYHLIAYDGVRSFGNVTELGTKICAIVQCANKTIESCGHIQSSSGTLMSIVVNLTTVNEGKMLLMPNTLTTEFEPLNGATWRFDRHEDGDDIHNSISLRDPTENLLTFGIWGRNFITDVPSSASKILTQLLYLPLFFILVQNVRNFF